MNKLILVPLLLAIAAAPQKQRGGNQPQPATARSIRCTPTSIRVSGGAPEPVQNSIAAALQRAAPGALIELESGVYKGFSVGFDKQIYWNARTTGGQRGQPITVRGQGDVRIVPDDSGDTIAFSQGVKVGFIEFENLTIVPGYRAGIMFCKVGAGQKYEGFHFTDCNITGSFDALTQTGTQSKWGVWGHSLSDFEFRGVARPAVVRDIQQEHGFYLQNAKGDITIENVRASRLGRTFVQFTARASDGDPGIGTIAVRNCVVEDACIAAGDDFKGGAAFTVAGRHTGTLIFEKNVYRAGFATGIQKLTREGVPYGSGAFVAWDNGGVPNGTLILRDNEFTLAPGCGDRPVVSIGGCGDVEIVGVNKFVSGGDKPALELDPVDDQGPSNTLNGRVRIAPTTQLKGAVRIAGKLVDQAALAALAPPTKAAPTAR